MSNNGNENSSQSGQAGGTGQPTPQPIPEFTFIDTAAKVTINKGDESKQLSTKDVKK